MRTIYWRRYGVVAPALTILALVVLTVGLFTFTTKEVKHPQHSHKKHVKDVVDSSLETDADFADLVRRPNLSDDEEDEIDDKLISDPEDDVVDHNEKADDSDFRTNAPSDLQEDGDGHGHTTTQEPTTVVDEADGATTQVPALEVPAVAYHGNLPAHHDAILGVPEYGMGEMPTLMDFQDGPLTEDEEYVLHLDEDAALHAREGLHGHIHETVDVIPDGLHAANPTDTPLEVLASILDTPSSDAPIMAGEPVLPHELPVPQLGLPGGNPLLPSLDTVPVGVDYQQMTGSESTVPFDVDDDYVAEEDGEEEPITDEAPEWYPKPEKPYNVLFIMADDMRPQIESYAGRDSGAPYDKHQMYTPHLDRLAKKSLVMKRAYAQYSMCGPSRTSMMTSRRPDVTKVFQNYVYWRYWSVGNFTTMPQYFKENNYVTLGAGKIFHVDMMPKDYDPVSWTMPYFKPRPSEYDKNNSINWAAVPDDNFEPLIDQNTAQYAVNRLPELARMYQEGNPFFFAVGFNQPHFRHICPEKFFKRYELEKRKCMFKEEWQTPPLLPKANLAQLVERMNNSELTNIPSVPMREMRRAYFACISYIDSLVGHMMQGLEENGLSNNTIVVFLSDQGYHAGDNNQLGVYSNHEIALHVPLIIKIPGVTNRGIETRALVELLDVFPTLVQATGLPPISRCPERSSEIRTCTDGVSLLPLIRRPKKYIKDAAYSQLGRGRSLTEYTVRTNKYRLIDMALHRRTPLYTGVYQHAIDFDISMKGRIHSRRLYDLTKDPLETENVEHLPEYDETVAWLRTKLKNTFTNIYDYSKYLFDSYPN